VFVLEEALLRAFRVGDSRNDQEDRLLDIYYDSEFDPLK
jgi:hypothetical protein